MKPLAIGIAATALGVGAALALLGPDADGVVDARAAGGTTEAAPPVASAPEPAEETGAHGLPHHFARINDRLFRSAQPEGDAEFQRLAEEGIRVVVSVDGARPEVEAAAAHDLRYVHIPIGYDGITPEQAAVIAKLVTTIDGPFLFHCHHGKHRGPAACAVALRAMEGADAEKAHALMKEAGTSAIYGGLWRDVAAFRPPEAEALARIPAEFPSAVAPAGMRRAMVEVDHTMDRVKAIRDAGWRATPEHPDVEPAHEAVILAESLREMQRLEETAAKPADYRRRLEECEKAAWDLAGVLDEPEPDAARALDVFKRIDTSCSACHGAYRNAR